MSVIYATKEQLADWMDPDADPPAIPPLATVLLRSASALVRSAASGAVYTVGADGFATDARVRTALREATCEQAQAWSIHGIDPRKGAAAGQDAKVVGAKSAMGLSVTYVADAAAAADLAALRAGDTLVGSAWRILEQAGLVTNTIDGTGASYARPVSVTPFDPITGTLEPTP